MKYKAVVIQGDIKVASVEGNVPEKVERDIQHYAFLYGQEGTITISRNRALVNWLNKERQ